MEKIKVILDWVLKICNILLLYIPRLISLLTPKGREKQQERKINRSIKKQEKLERKLNK